jgi:hypothetical protein
LITQIKNYKSPGYDEISVDMTKAVGKIGKQWLCHFLRKIWIEKRILEDWYKEIIVPVYKKGDRKQCGNHRRIELLCQIFKINERILVNKMTLEIKGKLA